MTLPETEPALAPEASPRAQKDPSGLPAALGAYLIWGFLPLLFALLDGVPTPLIVAERTLYALIVVGLVVAVTRRWGEVRAVFASRRNVALILLSAVLLAVNWLIYVFSVETGRVLESSFGYFINPLVNFALGMILLGERQRPLQAVAIGIAVIAILIQAVGLGTFPWIAISLAVSFGLYGFLRKTVAVGSATGLFVETLLLAPVCILYVAWFSASFGMGPHGDLRLVLLLAAAGPATAIPLLLFAYGVKRLRLTTIGMLQYLAPSIQFVLAITWFGEELNAVRLVSFVLIWVSLAVFSLDGFNNRRVVETP
jgi:chloramphenicol-sensitive protein RarD